MPPINVRMFDFDLLDDLSRIDVTVVEMSGAQHRVRMDDLSTVIDIKRAAAPLLQVPPEFQKLFIEDRVLNDSELLTDHLQEGTRELQLSFLFSAPLYHESIAARRAAIDALMKVVQGGRRQVVDVLISYTDDENEVCRQAAVSALGEIVQYADGRFLDAVVSRLMDSNFLIAASAVRCLARAAATGNEEAISILLEFVDVAEDQEIHVQLAVIEACEHLPRKHDQRISRSLQRIFKTVTARDSTRLQLAAKALYAKVSQRERGRVSCPAVVGDEQLNVPARQRALGVASYTLQ